MKAVIIALVIVGSTGAEMAPPGYHPQRGFRPSSQSRLLPLELNRQPQTLFTSPPSNQYTESALFQQTNNINVPSSVANRAKYAAFIENRKRQPQSLSGHFSGHLIQHESNNGVMSGNWPQLNYATPDANNIPHITNRINAFREPQRIYGPPPPSLTTQSPLETFDRFQQTNFKVPSVQYLPVFEPKEFGKTTTTEKTPSIDVRHGNLNANDVIQKAQVQKLSSQIEMRNRNEFGGNDGNAETKYLPPSSTTERSPPSTTTVRAPITTTSVKPVTDNDENEENVPNVAIATAISGNLYLIQPNGRLQKLRIVQTEPNINGFEEEKSFMNNQLFNVLYATPFYNLYTLGKR